MARTRVTNKSARTIHLTLPGHKGTILLPPGVTEVDTARFQETLKAQSPGPDGSTFNLVEKMREEGDLEWDGDGSQPRETRAVSSLPTQDAVKVIKETFTREQLDAYAKEDSRSEVQKAIEDQRAFVQSQNKPGSDLDSGDGRVIAPTGDQPSAADIAAAKAKARK